MIALDLDGTLAVENHQVLPRTRAGLHELQDSGVEIVIATGRRYRTTRYVIDNLGLDVYAVCNGGALVKNPDQSTLHKETFDIRPVVAIAREHGLPLFAQRDAHDDGGADVLIDNGPGLTREMDIYYRENRDYIEQQDLVAHGEPCLVSGTFGDADALAAMAAQIHAAFPRQYLTTIVRHFQTDSHYCEIAQGHVDKWHGLTRLHRHLGIDPDHICTVGDDLNDMPMVTRAGHGIAMGNGHEDLQASAVFVCGHNQEEGLVDVIDYIRRINNG
ncbi:MAG: HAD family hydrolase [Proteobacteria bacterium]|nr:HAD family hydrolase [Pseudomonadota bacterium]